MAKFTKTKNHQKLGRAAGRILKKFFSAHKTNNLKRQIYTLAAHYNERFYQCWERFMETISACPHHGFDTWMLVNHFYGGEPNFGNNVCRILPEQAPR